MLLFYIIDCITKRLAIATCSRTSCLLADVLEHFRGSLPGTNWTVYTLLGLSLGYGT